LKKKAFFKFLIISSLFLGLVIAWLGFGEKGFFNLAKMEKERQAYFERIQQLKNENQELRNEIERLRIDDQYIETIARKELGLIKENETLYRFDRERKLK
jgi:cell division protein FtsB